MAKIQPALPPLVILPRAFSISCLVGKAHHVDFAEMGIVAA